MNDLFKRIGGGQSFIGGEWVIGGSDRWFDVRNPATKELVGRISDCGATEALRAVDCAERALPGWRDLPASERARLLAALAAAMHRERADLARILTTEQGKPLKEAEREIVYAASFLEWFAGEAVRVYGETIPGITGSNKILVIKQPVGVCAAITPWNFPSAMVTRKLGAALAAGCTLILKPAPETPYSALAIAALAAEVGIPAGVMNVVCGDAETVAGVFMTNTSVRKISFTGSTEVGKLLYAQSAPTVKRITLELGGNAPCIIFRDADLARACTQSVHAKYRNAGQTCISVNRFLLEDPIAEQFIAQYAKAALAQRVGNGLEDGIAIGPVISDEAVQKIHRLVQDALTRGARVAFGTPPDGRSRFISPLGLSGITREMQIWQEEIFGPIATFTTFASEADALARANDTQYGLAAYLFTQDLSRAWRVMEGLQYGMVGVNDTVISAPQAPFGGIKQSGFGREGSRHGIEDYLNLKYVSLGV